jgi:hypothetical protein
MTKFRCAAMSRAPLRCTTPCVVYLFQETTRRPRHGGGRHGGQCEAVVDLHDPRVVVRLPYLLAKVVDADQDRDAPHSRSRTFLFG